MSGGADRAAGGAEIAWSEPEARQIVQAQLDLRGPLLPALRALQARFGAIDPRAVAVVADVLNLSRAEVHGVATFYRDFRTSPAGATVVRVCRAEACQARGSERLAAHARRRFSVEFGDTTGDGTFTLDEVFCLGNCARAPSITVNDQLFGLVTPDRMDALLAAADQSGATGQLGAAGQICGAGRSGAAGQMCGAGRLGADGRSGAVGRSGADGRLGADGRSGAAGHLGAAGAERKPAAVVYVPRDSSARSVGADQVAAALSGMAQERGIDVGMVRTGSRGMAWLEPLVEVATGRGRIGYGPVTVDDLPGLLDAGFLRGEGAAHRLHLGLIDAHPWLAAQERLTFARVGVIDPLDPFDFEAHGGLAGLRRALTMTPAQIVAEVTDSGLRGRGGAGFPTGIKWNTVLACPSDQKFISANGDEGDSGTFADRMLMEGDPFSLIEGMLIAGLAVGATEGYVYIRSEYPDAVATMDDAIQAAYRQGWLGRSVVESGQSFDLFLRVGAGSYICGEETAMLESLEGKRGVVRAKPPLPAIEGLFGQPTVVNNVLTLATVPTIVAHGSGWYKRRGVGRSRGTQVFQLAGNVAHGGIVETAFGVTLGQLVSDYGGGTASGRAVRAVQVGGPLGAYLPVSQFDRPMDYEAFATAGAIVGHGGIVVFDDTVDMAQQARFAMSFCAEESCGKCTPCRVGAVRGVEVIDRIIAGEGDGDGDGEGEGDGQTDGYGDGESDGDKESQRQAGLVLLEDLCELMASASLCAMGGLTPLPVRSALEHFRSDFSPSRERMGPQP